jgi:hypothetical protein
MKKTGNKILPYEGVTPAIDQPPGPFALLEVGVYIYDAWATVVTDWIEVWCATKNKGHQ